MAQLFVLLVGRRCRGTRYVDNNDCCSCIKSKGSVVFDESTVVVLLHGVAVSIVLHRRLTFVPFG